MYTVEWLKEFYATIAEDSRITATHISLYIAIYFAWESQDCKVCMEIDRRQIMQLAKISSPVTYHKCIHALHDFGYINYVPYSGRKKSVVKLRRL